MLVSHRNLRASSDYHGPWASGSELRVRSGTARRLCYGTARGALGWGLARWAPGLRRARVLALHGAICTHAAVSGRDALVHSAAGARPRFAVSISACCAPQEVWVTCSARRCPVGILQKGHGLTFYGLSCPSNSARTSRPVARVC